MKIDLSRLYLKDKQAKIDKSEDYIQQVIAKVGQGKDVTLTGSAPVWLYLRVAHALHGKAKILYYESPVTGKVEIFNHNPYAD